MIARRLFLTTLLALFAAPLTAGFTYRIDVVSDATRATSISARAYVEGSTSRVEFEHGDGMLFRDGNIALSTDAGRTVRVVDPAAKTYYDLDVDRQSGDALSLLDQLGASAMISGTRVDVRDEGAGVPLAGLPTHRYRIIASFDVRAAVLGQTIDVHVVIDRQLWKTDRLDAGAASFLQAEHTGIAAIDQLLGQKSGAVRGFTLKEISRVAVSTGGSRLVNSTTTVTITDVTVRKIAPETFRLPQGLQKMANPLDRAIGSLR
jgi:hypothetical protein